MKNRIKIRIPLPNKPGRPIGTPSGKKGYDRKREREELRKAIKDFYLSKENH